MRWFLFTLMLFGANGLLWVDFRDKMAMKVDLPEVVFNTPIEYHDLPTSVDWRGKTGPVRDQGPCGSCWAHAAIGAIESAWQIGGKKSVNLSIEEIVSCVNRDHGYESLGCNGGYSPDVFDWVMKRGDVEEFRWPYDQTIDACNETLINEAKLRLRDKSTDIQAGNEAALMAAVAERPVVIYFDVTQDFVAFWSGVFKPYTCGRRVDHAMLVVGYAVNTSVGSYWIVQNSWGPQWGADGGFVKIAMTGNGYGPCGMYQYMYQPSGEFDVLDEYRITVKMNKPRDTNVLCPALIKALGNFSVTVGKCVTLNRRKYYANFKSFLGNRLKEIFTFGNAGFTKDAELSCGSVLSVLGMSFQASPETCLRTGFNYSSILYNKKL